MLRLIRLFAGALLAFACVTSAYSAQRNDVLVIVNDNSHDSPIVGNYYAQQRNIKPVNVIHVNIPNQYYIDWNQFTSLRDQILRLGICPTIPAASQPVACSDTSQPIYTQANISTLTSLTPIKYLVTTRGVPSQVNTYLLSGDSEPTSVDNYLRIWLAGYYQKDTIGNVPNQRGIDFGNGEGMRVVNPARDGEYIIGRIDGVDLASAQALVNRAIQAEANGIYGNLFASTFGNIASGGHFQWTNYGIIQPIYQAADGSTEYWRYAFAPFGESRPECADYKTNYLLIQPQNKVSGKAPIDCRVQFNWGEPDESIPGLDYSREPKAYNAIGYFGSLDGQTIEGGFPTLLNWRKNKSCSVTLCSNAADPAVCQANSTDPFKEINTDCVGVANGFIGYNFQSWPISIFGIWPTGWQSVNIYYNNTPIVKNNDGVDDLYSAWFSNPDDVSGSSQQYVGMQQPIYFANPPTTAQTYKLSYFAKLQNASTSVNFSSGIKATYTPDGSISNPVCPSDPAYSTLGKNCVYTVLTSNSATGVWPSTALGIDISVPGIAGWKNSKITVRLGNSEQLPPGIGLGFDNVSFKNTNNLSTELIANGSFNQGHQQVSQGDYAANFLGRLGGTAFWGSLTHHGSLGHSFDSTALGTLVYFMRGLPLGDAVWLGVKHNDGDLYGDPIYSPIAVRIKNPSTNSYNFVPQSVVNLSGSAVNGNNTAAVSTSYSVEYCVGGDFFICDKSGSWASTGISGTGPLYNASIGNWNTTNLPTGQYLLRLSVTSTNSSRGVQQTFYDYQSIIIYNATSDFDGDGVLDTIELAQGGNPILNIDTDHDGISDDAERIIYHTDPLKPDTDGDGLTDGQEILIYHTNPLKMDTDGDGLTDGQEVNITHTDPLNPNSVLANVLDANLDPFSDGVGYAAKLVCGLDVTKSQQGLDSDSDGMSDLAECLAGRNPFVNEPALVPNILYMLGF